AQRRRQQFLGVAAVDAVEQLLGLQWRVAEVDESVAGKRTGVAVVACRKRHLLLELSGDLLAQLDDDSLGSPFSDPRRGLEALRVAGGDRSQQLARRATGEHRDRHLRPDAADRDELAEEV